MSLDFPASPTTGQQYNDWVFDGTAWQFAQTQPGGLPCGSIIPWAGTSAPVNWLLCDGAAISRTTYSSLFTVIGTTYGAGNGTTTFNLPDLRGRVPVGRDGGSFGTLGATGGVETVTLTVDQIPSHTHTQNSHNHTQDSHNHTQNAHNHGLLNGGSVLANGGGSTASISTGGGGYVITSINNATPTNNPTTATNQPATATNQNTGGGQSHTNVQPFQVVNYIIKHTVAITPGESELAPRVTALEEIRPVNIGGTGASSFTSGSYLKGAGTSAITTQSGIPAGDITSGALSRSRMPSGAILQVLESARTSSVTVSGQYSYADTGLSITITPTSASSRFRLTGNLIASCSAAGWIFMRFVRNSTVVGNGTIGTSINHNAVTYIEDFGRIEPLNGSFIDSPATTSAITYKIQFATFTGTGILNRRSADTLFGGYSNFIVEEIA